jgi:hypothetical protein
LRNEIATRASLSVSQIPVTIELPRPNSTYHFMISQPPTSDPVRQPALMEDVTRIIRDRNRKRHGIMKGTLGIAKLPES